MIGSKAPLYIFNAIFIKIVDSLFLQKVVDRRFPIFTSKISSFIEKRLKIGGARARQLFRNNEQLPKGKHKERPDSQISRRAEKLRQYRIILSADTASEVRQMPSQKRR